MVSRQNSSDSADDRNDSDLFKEAEDFFRGKMNNFMGLGYSCGIASRSKERCQQEITKAFGEEDVDKPIVLSWRMDPRQSMSDWVLVIKDERQSHIYHVHKELLVYGERKSGFFLKLFEKIYKDGNPNQRNVTEVPIDTYCSLFVPIMLDYIYEDKLDLNAMNAPGLRHVANHFDVRHLYALVSSFIQQDMSNMTVATYLEQAQLSHDQELSDIAMQMSVQSFNMISDEEISKIPPQIFQQVVSDQNLNVPSPEILSQRIATYMRARDQDIDDESFFFLTHANILPKIHPSEAIFYLSFASKHFPSALEGDNDGGYEGTLQRRCVVATAADWNKYISPIQHDIKRKKKNSGNRSDTGQRLFGNGSDLDEMGYSYLALPALVKVDILQEALLKASLEKKEKVFTKSHTFNPRAKAQIDNPGTEFRSSTPNGRKKFNVPKIPTQEQLRELRSDTPSRRDRGMGSRNNLLS